MAHLLLKARDDRVEKRLFIREKLFLRDLQALVWALPVDQCRDQARNRIAQHGIEGRAQPVIKPAFDMQKEGEGVTHQIQKRRAGIGSRHWATSV